MVITKILEGVLVAGQTSISFTDSDISNSLIRTYSSDDDLYPVSRTIAGNTLTITYEAQSTNKGIAIEIVKEGLDIVDNVTSTDTNKALSANQGKVLKDSIITSLSGLNDVNINTPEDDDMLIYDNGEWINAAMPSIPANIDDLDDVTITSPSNGQVLTYNDGEWVNAGSSAGGTSYSTSERSVGTWIDNSTLYQITVDIGTLSANSSKTLAYSDIGISNVDKIVYLDIMINNTHNSNFNRPDNANTEFYTQMVATGIFIRTYNTAISSGYATIRYTKSS